MFTYIFISFYLFSIINGAPISDTASSDKLAETAPEFFETLPDIDPFDSTTDKIEYEVLGGGFQGDMIFPKGINESILSSQDRGVARFGLARWPNNIIPYDISKITSVTHRNMILEAMSTLMYAAGTPIPGQIARKACIYFRPKQKTDKNFFTFQYGDGCSATVGYWYYMDMVMNLNNPGCFYSGTIQHELMHVLGFYHEQSRPDRDSYITINYENIESGMEHNFNKFSWGRSVFDLKTPYDLNSIMHYGANFFSTNGKPTITPKKSNVRIGQRQQLSATDILEIRKYYNC